MAVSKGLGTYGDGAGVVTPTDHKLAQLGIVTKTGAGTNAIRAGLFFDGVSNIVTGAANMSYNVAPFTAVSSRGPGQGAVLFANDGTVNVVTTAAPGTNSRIDVVYVWQREFALDGGSTAPVIGVVQGTPASSPAVPSLSAFPGAIELARITVPAGVTATNSGTTITQTGPFTCAAGGVLPVRAAAELPVTAVRNQLAVSVSTNDVWQFNGTDWSLLQTSDYRWPNAAARTAQAGMRAGDLGLQLDTDVVYRYNGSTWKIWEGTFTVTPAASITLTRGGIRVAGGVATADFNLTKATNINSGDIIATFPTSVIAIGAPAADPTPRVHANTQDTGSGRATAACAIRGDGQIQIVNPIANCRAVWVTGSWVLA